MLSVITQLPIQREPVCTCTGFGCEPFCLCHHNEYHLYTVARSFNITSKFVFCYHTAAYSKGICMYWCEPLCLRHHNEYHLYAVARL